MKLSNASNVDATLFQLFSATDTLFVSFFPAARMQLRVDASEPGCSPTQNYICFSGLTAEVVFVVTALLISRK